MFIVYIITISNDFIRESWDANNKISIRGGRKFTFIS